MICRGGTTAILVPLLVALWAAGVAGQTAAPTVDELRARLDDLKGQITAEQQSLEKSRQARTAELQRLTDQRSQRAATLLQLELSRQKLAAEDAALAKVARDAAAARKRLDAAAGASGASAAGVAEQLSLQLQEIPGAQPLIAQLGSGAAGYQQLFEVIDALHEQATQVTLKPATIWTAGGHQETVELLAAGHIAFAYRAADGRLGLALASPADASGYRWTEQLPREVASALQTAFEQVRSGGQSTVSIPMDATGRLRIEAVTPDEGLWQTIRAGGPVMAPIGLVALLAVIFILERLFVLYGRNRLNPSVVVRVLEATRRQDYAAAQHAADSARCVLGRTLAACLRRRRAGQHAMEDSIQEQLLHELPRLQRFLGGIAVLAAVAPLLGLLGTVTGIIDTFGVIRAFGNANPGLMAGGISEALITTAAGLMIAIPILLVHSMLRGRVDRIISEAEKHAATLLNTLAHDQPPDESTPPQKALEQELANVTH